MWARRSLFDQENPWNNFGFLMNIYQKNSVRYVNVLQGLWFAFWTGPRPSNVKISLYLLFDLGLRPAEAIDRGYPESAVLRIVALEQANRFKRRLMLIARLSGSAINLDQEIPRD